MTYVTHLSDQSSPDKLMPFRILKYICAIIDKHVKQVAKSELPLVYPIVFHHANTTYPYSADIKDLIAAPKRLIDSYWLKPFQLTDVGQISDEANEVGYLNRDYTVYRSHAGQYARSQGPISLFCPC